MLPEGKVLGGAPLNVLYHAQKNGLSGKIISAVGSDDLGQEIKDKFQEYKLSLDLVQELPNSNTGVAAVSLDEKGSASYELVQPVAYDNIELTEENKQAIAQCDAFVFGSLANRSEKTLSTLLKLVSSQSQSDQLIKVFDVNLRPPHFNLSTIDQLAHIADIIKLNDEELEILAVHHQISGDKQTLMNLLIKKYNLRAMVCTLGSEGAIYVSTQEIVQVPGLKVDIGDTVGAGDAFLAALISGYLQGLSAVDFMTKANKLGAFVASQKGAIISY